jgi:hypothetical protein
MLVHSYRCSEEITRSSVEKWDKKQKGLDEKLDSREASVILVKYDKKNE